MRNDLLHIVASEKETNEFHQDPTWFKRLVAHTSVLLDEKIDQLSSFLLIIDQTSTRHESTIKHGGSSSQGVGTLYRWNDWDDADRERVDGSSGILERMYIEGSEQIFWRRKSGS